MRNNSRELILLHHDTKPRYTDKTVDIMLSPSLYTLTKKPLEIKYKRQAKALAPSVLDELLDEGEYSYDVFKDIDGVWVFIAYDKSKIIKLLDKFDVNRVYFAQQSFELFKHPISLNSNQALGLVDNIVTTIPKIAFGEGQRFLSFDNSFTPNSGGFKLSKSSNDFIDIKSSIILSIIFMIFAISFGVEGYGYSSTISNQSINELLEDYPSLQSKYSRDSILSKYNKIDKIERKKREFLKSISSIVKYGAKLQTLIITDKAMIVTMSIKDKSIYSDLAKSIKIKDIGNGIVEFRESI